MSNMPNWIRTADDLKEGCEKYIREYGFENFEREVLSHVGGVVEKKVVDQDVTEMAFSLARSCIETAVSELEEALEELS